MVTVVKSEWHQVEKRYSLDITTDLLEEIYPDYTEEEIQSLHSGLLDGSSILTRLSRMPWMPMFAWTGIGWMRMTGGLTVRVAMRLPTKWTGVENAIIYH